MRISKSAITESRQRNVKPWLECQRNFGYTTGLELDDIFKFGQC